MIANNQREALISPKRTSAAALGRGIKWRWGLRRQRSALKEGHTAAAMLPLSPSPTSIKHFLRALTSSVETYTINNLSAKRNVEESGAGGVVVNRG